jgi:hypothetical protein
MAVATSKPVDLNDLIDIPGAAALVFVSRKTIENWLSSKVLTRFKVNGGRTLVSKRELLKLITREES